MERRLMGEELELGLAGVSNAEIEIFAPRFVSTTSMIDNPKLGFRDKSSDFAGRQIWWLTNGAKFYKDTGDHPEYATPECVKVKDFVAHDKASEDILRKIWRLCSDAKRPGFAVVKNNVCYHNPDANGFSRGFSWGLHENYLTRAYIKLDRVAEELSPHFVTRIIYSGAGHIQPYNRNFHFVLSSRADFIDCLCSNSATNHKPLILERPESHANNQKWNRIQVVCGEANMLQLPIFLRFMTNHLCLRLIEEGWHLPAAFKLKNPINQLWRLNHDIYCRDDLRLLFGLSKKAVDIQRLYLFAAKKLNPISDEEREGLGLWEWTLDLLSQDLTRDANMQKLVGVLDWATKWYLIKKELEKNNCSLGHKKILAFNILYHSLDESPDKSLWARLVLKDKEKPFMFHVVRQDDIDRALTEPPDSRAKLRSCLIKLAIASPQKLNVYNINWEDASVLVEGHKNIVRIDFGSDDPFKNSLDELEYLKQILSR